MEDLYVQDFFQRDKKLTPKPQEQEEKKSVVISEPLDGPRQIAVVWNLLKKELEQITEHAPHLNHIILRLEKSLASEEKQNIYLLLEKLEEQLDVEILNPQKPTA